MQPRRPTGSGPGTITADGCAVELYAMLPSFGEPELIHAAIPAGAGVLDLGCGTGRILRPLAGLGHPVVGVDESPEMLAHCAGLDTIRSRIEELALTERFGVVLLASNLVNTPDAGQRAGWLAVAVRHLRPAGTVVIQQHPPTWFDGLTASSGQRGGITLGLQDITRDGPLVSATAVYEVDGRRWTHSFTTLRRTDAELRADLHAAGLELDRWLTDDHGWLTARPMTGAA